MRKTQPFHTFSAVVHIIDINPYVRIPDEILLNLQKEAKKEKGPVPVKGTLQGKPFIATVVRFRGMWRLYLNLSMRRDAGVEVGDRVTIEVRYDDTPRIVPAPKMFTETLSKNKPARDAFQKLPASRQKEILQYLNSLKRPETLERNIEKIIRILQSKM